jgi:Carboxypeptidase regulatory-like domain
MTIMHVARAAGLWLAFVALGCGDNLPRGPEKQATVPATGVLRYRGKPVPNASVTFQALDGKVTSFGRTDAAGSFTLSTYGSQDGIPPGRYKVTAAAGGAREVEPGVLDDEPKGGFRSPIPAKYANPDTTDILVEVKEQGRNDFTLELK